MVPKLREEPDNFGGKIRIGLLGVKRDPMGPIRYERMGPVKALEAGVERTWFIVDSTFRYLGKLVTGRESADQLGGPIAMAKAAGDAASMGFSQFVAVIAFLSVSIGLLNLFPIPMLDGGHLVYYADRGGTWQAAWRKRSGMGFPHRFFAGDHADGGRHLERPHAGGNGVVWWVSAWGSFNCKAPQGG